MVVPRRAGRIAGGELAANAAAMVGIVWMTEEHEYEEWTKEDPMRLLPQFGIPVGESVSKATADSLT